MGLELGYPDLGIVPVPPDILPRGLFVEEPVAGPPDILGVRQKPDLVLDQGGVVFPIIQVGETRHEAGVRRGEGAGVRAVGVDGRTGLGE